MELHVPTRAPSNLAVTNTGGAVNVSWGDNSQIETGYRVERSLDGGAWAVVGQGPLPANTISASDSVSCGVTASYRITALNDSNGSASTEALAPVWLCAPSIELVGTRTSSGNGSNWRWSATVTFTLRDSNGASVSGATVTGSWAQTLSSDSKEKNNLGTDGPFTGDDVHRCTTGTTGTCSVTLSGMQSGVLSATFTVDSVTGSARRTPLPARSRPRRSSSRRRGSAVRLGVRDVE